MCGPTASASDRLRKNALYSKYSGISTLQLRTGTRSLIFRLYFPQLRKLQLEEMISEFFKSVKALNSLQSYSIISILDRHTPTTFVTFLPHVQRRFKSGKNKLVAEQT